MKIFNLPAWTLINQGIEALADEFAAIIFEVIHGSSILLESGDYLLLESGDSILLE